MLRLLLVDVPWRDDGGDAELNGERDDVADHPDGYCVPELGPRLPMNRGNNIGSVISRKVPKCVSEDGVSAQDQPVEVEVPIWKY
jgi:hypothetical protein